MAFACNEQSLGFVSRNPIGVSVSRGNSREYSKYLPKIFRRAYFFANSARARLFQGGGESASFLSGSLSGRLLFDPAVIRQVRAALKIKDARTIRQTEII